MFGSDNKDNNQADAPATHDDGWQHPGTPIDDQQVAQTEPTTEITPEVTESVTAESASEAVSEGTDFTAPEPQAPTIAASSTDLSNIKQKALKQLTPLIDQLDQAPEEKFRTLMMTIQASDDQSLVSAAYEAASHIIDEKAKAQALLDIVNEINYFSAQHD